MKWAEAFIAISNNPTQTFKYLILQIIDNIVKI